jgi:DNA-directed RNA polymerase specialized sigma24 family protein
MTPSAPGVATLRQAQTGKTDADAVDATLAASGDARAFERLYRTHVGRIYSLVRRMLSDQEAGEVAQDIFVRAWQSSAPSGVRRRSAPGSTAWRSTSS